MTKSIPGLSENSDLAGLRDPRLYPNKGFSPESLMSRQVWKIPHYTMLNL